MASTNILLVDDDETAFRVTESVIGKIGGERDYNVEWANDFEDGLRKIFDNRHDIYLIDYKLAANDGLELIQAARAKGHNGPFVMLTGMDQSDLYTKSIETGVYDYLLKSELTASALDRSIRYALERKRVEDALREEKAFSSFIISEVPYLVVSVNRDGNISSVNPFVTQITGRDEAYFVGKNWKCLIADEEQRENVVFKVTDEDHIGFEAPLLGKDGCEHHILWNVLNKKVSTTASQNLSFVLSGKDMTEQMESEALERQKQKTEALGHLAGGVAHEINNLLQPILFSADIIKSRVDDEKMIESADKIMRNTVSASKIVDDILTFARKDSTNNEDMPILRTVKESFLFLEDMIPETTEVDDSGLDQDEDFEACINRTDMMRVIKNTVINASHAMDDKGMVVLTAEKVLFESMNKKLDVAPGAYMKIGVTDTGCGIPEDVVSRIYDPFFTTKDTGKGTGLGLSIVYNIIRSWKGGVEIISEVGKGTSFYFYIPVKV